MEVHASSAQSIRSAAIPNLIAHVFAFMGSRIVDVKSSTADFRDFCELVAIAVSIIC